MKVTSGLDNPRRVALWERHPDHPGGEVFVVGDRVVDVAETTAVAQALKAGRLVKVEPVRAQTVDEVLAAVESGEISPQDALAAERQGKGRVTLIDALEALLANEEE